MRSVVALIGLALATHAAALPAQTRTMYDVRVSMRDGVELSTDVWLPDPTAASPPS